MITLHTNHGDINIELNAEKAPVTVANFIKYAKDGFYNGTIFHRVISSFMIQGGGFTEDMVQKPTNEPIINEANNGLSNTVGTIAMARTLAPHSASSQFFINVKDNPSLDFRSESAESFGYCVFGKVVDGMDVVNKIKEVDVTYCGMHQNVPVEPVIIERVTVQD